MFVLHSYPDRFVIDADSALSHSGEAGLVSAGAESSLVIDRASGSMSRAKTSHHRSAQGVAFSERIDGVLGIIELLRGRYLIVMTGSKHVATVQGCPIRQLVDSKIIPFSSDKYSMSHALTAEQEKEETKYLALLRAQLACGFFYFSYDYDLTLTTQRIALNKSESDSSSSGSGGVMSQPMWKRADPRFFWNEYLMRELISASNATSNGGTTAGCTDDFIIPLINGYVFQQHQKVRGHDVTFVLLSRRERYRTGRRFILRGLDEHTGAAANFAEQEQIIFVTDPADLNSTRVASFTQTRGSIPVLWEQPVTLKYTPKIHFQRGGQPVDIKDEQARRKFEAATELACRKHFETQVGIYGKQICLNLVNQKGAELALVKAFKANVDLLGRNDVRLINWDFHQECRKMKYENIGKLCELVKDDVESMSYFCARVSSAPSSASASAAAGQNRGGAPRVTWSISKKQSGSIRTNCIDCLDRTNVVQSVFARRVLDKQLLELTGFDARTEKHPALDSMFRNVWANNADAMSLQYSGTGALKTDYTRTGKRTLRGACMDGVNSVTRYYLNNFRDGTNQDATDLFLGVYQPPSGAAAAAEPSPFKVAQSRRSHPAHQKSLASFVWAFTLAMALLVVTWTNLTPPSLSPHRQWGWGTQLAAFGALTTVLGFKLVTRYGKDYANKPLLRHFKKQ